MRNDDISDIPPPACAEYRTAARFHAEVRADFFSACMSSRLLKLMIFRWDICFSSTCIIDWLFALACRRHGQIQASGLGCDVDALMNIGSFHCRLWHYGFRRLFLVFFQISPRVISASLYRRLPPRPVNTTFSYRRRQHTPARALISSRVDDYIDMKLLAALSSYSFLLR